MTENVQNLVAESLDQKVKKVLIQTGKAVSLNVIAQHIAKVVDKFGLTYILSRYTPSIYNIKNYCDAVIFIYPFSQAWSINWFLAYREAKKILKKGVVFYTLIDGKPKTMTLPNFVRSECEFIANSYYTAQNLTEAGFKVLKVVHHGYDPEEVEASKVKVEIIRKVLKERYGDKVTFLYVGDFNIRKGIPELLYAVKKVSEKRKDFVVLLFTTKYVIKLLKDVQCVEWIGEFGSRPHYEIYALYRAVDFLVLPSRAESFGLPLLEANVVGRPAIVTALPPFLEYADTKYNIFVQWSEQRYTDTGDGIWYDLRFPDVNDLANAIEYAIDIRKNYPSMYEEMCEKVRKKVEHMTIYNLYKEFVEMIK